MKVMPNILHRKCIARMTMDHYPEFDTKYGLPEHHWFFVCRGNSKLGAIVGLTLNGILVQRVSFSFCAERLQRELIHRLGLEAGTAGELSLVSTESGSEAIATESEEAFGQLLDAAQKVLEAVISGQIEISSQELAASLPQVGPKPESFNPDQDEVPLTDDLKAELSTSELELAATEAPRVVRERIGQQRYRKCLEQLWDGKCAVTGVSEPCLLRASHAKPWNKCETGKERLSPFNGFLLNVALDALFDKFLISFADDGSIMIAPSLKPEDLAAVGITPEMRIVGIRPEHLPFLSYHRAQFQQKAKEHHDA